MIKPNFLKSGDTVALVAPGRKIKRELVDHAAHIIKSWGLEVMLSANLFSDQHAYLAGTDEERITDFQSALDNTSVKAIICVRGGYGSTRILDNLDFSQLQINPKWIVGFSDVTAIHLKVFNTGVQSIHGTMPVLFSKQESELSVKSLRDVLFGEDCTLVAPIDSANRHGQCSGTVVGGNLSLLVDSLGTSNELDTRGKILIIEEIDEYYYKVDRMFTHLKRAGKLKQLAGLAIGHFTDITNSELGFGESVISIVNNAVKEYNFPVGFGFPTGHENPNLAWICGGHAFFDVGLQQVSLKFD